MDAPPDCYPALPGAEDSRAGLAWLVHALMVFYVLAQGANTTFLLANGEFQFFVEAMDAIQISGTEKFKQQSGYLREITENVFYFRGETLIFGALDHESLLRNSDIW